MKIKVLQENIKKRLNYLQKAIPTKSHLPVLNSIVLQTKEHTVSLTASDLYYTVITHTEAEIEEQGKVLVNGQIFYQLINSFNAGEIEISSTKKNLKINKNKNKTTLATQKISEYPDLKTFEDSNIQGELTVDDLESIESYVAYSASLDQTRPILTALNFKLNKKNTVIAATDNHRLAVLTLNKNFSLGVDEILVPVKAIHEVLKIAQVEKQDKINFQISKDKSQIKFNIKQTQVFCRLIEGEYPPYEQIVPSEFDLKIEIDKEKLVQEIKRAQIIVRGSSNIIKFKIDSQKLSVLSSSSSFGKYQGEIMSKISTNLENIDDKPQEIAFKAGYVLDFLNNAEDETVVFEMNESLKPAMFTLKGKDNYYYLAMPFKIND